MDIHISNNAADFIRQKVYNMPGHYALRVYIKSIGCCSLDLGAAFDETRSTDNSYTTKGIKIIIDKKMAKNIKGFRIDGFTSVNVIIKLYSMHIEQIPCSIRNLHKKGIKHGNLILLYYHRIYSIFWSGYISTRNNAVI